MQGLLELVIEVADFESALAFYKDLLCLEEVDRWAPARQAAWLGIGRNAVLGLWPASSGGERAAIAGARGGAHVHFAVYVERGTLDGWQQRIEAAGSKVTGPVAFSHGKRSLFVSDPDGNAVELADWDVDWAGQPTNRPRQSDPPERSKPSRFEPS